ncbi:MAG TPA: sulfite exporter TauE/SafE family protein [Caldithrix abyssi]|uniref:Sulfite exporter TauE/SafE family protein n=1 Tax=Caldithrix abyssi TaxID=187145 RepID=A0A7V5RQU7_CALAY|nr:sulfite exporter TauE/SafE family protein [Caldithrix abyssi]
MLTALLLGTLGSLHCVGMCGPIVLALPQNKTNTVVQFLFSRLTYNSGRLVSYAILGVIFGSIGHLISLAGFQSLLSITLGVVVIATLFLPLDPLLNFVNQSSLWKKTIGALFRKKSYSALWAIGFLNGYLPCGLVYTALAGAAASGSALYGAGFMAVFGLGTIPALMIVAFLGKRLSWQGRKWIRKALPVAAFVLGVLLILRGLSLGIPYVSPDLQMHQTEQGLFIPHCQ